MKRKLSVGLVLAMPFIFMFCVIAHGGGINHSFIVFFLAAKITLFLGAIFVIPLLFLCLAVWVGERFE